jgi:hypothetical protein
MNESDCLAKMIAPGTVRPSKPYRGGVIQILVTSSCDQSCTNCTQASNISRKNWYMTPEQFDQACLSLKGYFGVVGVFGGNPCMSPHFKDYCEIMVKHFPLEQRGLWCNNPLTVDNARLMAKTFHAPYSNLNVHLNHKAFEMFKEGWPECNPVGLERDSRHSPCFTSMKDLGIPEEERHELISKCDINQHWSAGIGVFRGQLRAWFCEIAMAMSILHQWDTEWVDDALHSEHPEAEPRYTYPDTGIPLDYPIYKSRTSGEVYSCRPYTEIECDREVTRYLDAPTDTQEWESVEWWQFPMAYFQNQVRIHCHDCGVPLRGKGELAMAERGKEQVSLVHLSPYKLKKKERVLQVVTNRAQLGQSQDRVTTYLQSAKV